MLLEIVTGDIHIDNSTRGDLTYLVQKTEFEGLEFICHVVNVKNIKRESK